MRVVFWPRRARPTRTGPCAATANRQLRLLAHSPPVRAAAHEPRDCERPQPHLLRSGGLLALFHLTALIANTQVVRWHGEPLGGVQEVR